jgi:hypothetical protein
MRSPLLIKLLRLINRVGLVSGRPWTKLLTPVITLIRKLISQPQVAELFRFIFLGTIVETGRQMAQWISDFTRDCELLLLNCDSRTLTWNIRQWAVFMVLGFQSLLPSRSDFSPAQSG